MNPIRNIADLRAEKARLQALKQVHEQHFAEKMGKIQTRFEPYKSWFSRIDNFANKKGGGGGSRPNSMVRNAIEVTIPLLVDRVVLGTRGLLLKKGLTLLTQFAASRISQESPGELAGKLFKVIPSLARGLTRGASPLMKRLFHKRGDKKRPTGIEAQSLHIRKG